MDLVEIALVALVSLVFIAMAITPMLAEPRPVSRKRTRRAAIVDVSGRPHKEPARAA